ncbi:carboxypeptidase regulatory-like domain-containing protein [Myxococcus sp. K38C18041901]|uniref:carboxypeptidase regulatory-like domain-containing protein n=1 Tax=Myxococcus guangdongensis TaxID=2906760 RepID=UPI0020A6DE1F|nr:carboxypeptidase regulatory-like domain-containing protein [Myxococcus guangdongensis]MCP3065683.1 carboxypeptidase regulatory-like domain-containing protein [Myxococcus guangdongensis]
MRRPLVLALTLAVLTLGAGVAFVLLRDSPSEPATSPASVTPFTHAPLAQTRGTLSLRGRVLAADRSPASGVELSVSRALPGESLSLRPCGEDVDLPLSSPGCEDLDMLAALRDLIQAGRGDTPVVARVTTHADGTFEVKNLPEGTVALWAVSAKGAALATEVTTGTEDVELVLEPSVVFAGRVVDEALRPVVGSKLTLFHTEHSRFFQTTSDSDGRFTLGPLPASTYGLQVDDDQLVGSCMRETSPDALEAEDIVLHRPRSIVGQVLLEDERPVANALVEAVDTGVTAETDARGRFTLEGLPPGDYVLKARHGQQQGQAEATLDEEQSEVEVTVRLGTLVRVTGSVRDTAGQPIEGATVLANSRGTVYYGTEALTGADGRFELEEATLGTHHFTVSAKGFLPTETTVVEVTHRTPPVELTMERAFVVEGLVVDEAGTPLTEVTLSAMKWLRQPKGRRDGKPHDLEHGDPDAPFADGPVIDAATDDTGRFVLNLPSPGLYRLSPNVTGFLETTLEVEAPARDVRVVMQRGARVVGTVVNLKDAPIPNVAITLRPVGQEEPVPIWVRSDAQGAFQLEGVPPGRFILRASLEHSGVGDVSVDVTVTGTETKTVTMRMDGGLSIAGLVVNEAGTPLPGASIFAYPLTEPDDSSRRRFGHHAPLPPPAQAQSNEQGRFTLEHLSNGRYRVDLTMASYALRGSDTPDVDDTRRVSGVQAQAGVTDLKLVVRYVGGVRGRLVREDRTPITRFNIDDVPYRDANGAFQVPVEQPGTTWLTLEAPGLTRVVRQVEVIRGQDLDLGDVVLKAGRRLRGRVLDARTSAPVVGLEVDVKSPGAEARRGEDSGDMDEGPPSLASAITRADGTFELPPLEAGPLVLTLTHPDYLPRSEQVGDGSAPLELRVSAGARLEGTVKDREGRPVDTDVQVVNVLSPEDSLDVDRGTGTFRVSGLPPGEYAVAPQEDTNFQGDSVRFLPQRVRLGPDERKVLHFQEMAGATTLKLNLPERGAMMMTERVALLNTYLFPGDVPLPKSLLELEQLGRRLAVPSWPYTDTRFEELSAGHYTFFFTSMNFDTRREQVHRGEVDLPASGVVALDVQPTWRALAPIEVVEDSEAE